jgi:hypothetical protein
MTNPPQEATGYDPVKRMSFDPDAFRVPLDGFEMHLRRSELQAVAAGLGERNLTALADALRSLPVRDRAPLWELAVRRFGRGKVPEQAAGEIGMDAIRARQLLSTFTAQLT